MTVIPFVPSIINTLVQRGAMQRAFHESLFPTLLFRSEVSVDDWPENAGEDLIQTRTSTLKPATKALVPGVDPQPKVLAYEQWRMTLERFGDTMDTDMRHNAHALGKLFLENVHAQGLQAGQTYDRLPRNILARAYLSGQTVLTAGASAGDRAIRVAAVNGFTDVVRMTRDPLPRTVSTSSPLPVVINRGAGAGAFKVNVIGFEPDRLNDLYGPGVLYLDAAVPGGGLAARTDVTSIYAPDVIRVGGGFSVDALQVGDTFNLLDIFNVNARLARHHVMPHSDGYYHAHIPPEAVAQIFGNQVFQQLHQGQPDNPAYKKALLGIWGNIMFIQNTETPDVTNSGDTISTGSQALYSDEVGAETVNESGVRVGRIIVTGRGALYERNFDEMKYLSDVGVNGKAAKFQVTHNQVVVPLDRIRLIIRAPMDRFGDQLSHSWSVSSGFAAPSDVGAQTGSQRYKRAIVMEFAMGTWSGF